MQKINHFTQSITLFYQQSLQYLRTGHFLNFPSFLEIDKPVACRHDGGQWQRQEAPREYTAGRYPPAYRSTCWPVAKLGSEPPVPTARCQLSLSQVSRHKDGIWQTWWVQMTEAELAGSEHLCFLLPGCIRIKPNILKQEEGIWGKGEWPEGFNPIMLSISVGRTDHGFLKCTEDSL